MGEAEDRDWRRAEFIKRISAVNLMSPSGLRSPVEFLQIDRESVLSPEFVWDGITGSSVPGHIFFANNPGTQGASST